ncbi:putative protein ilm1 [Erysiphe neolycopersici]|uniref:Increased loss of mitochondrial DNA protein 1 n=1 Tax=Erysiphe neolycopersici TaxID=212602 RepID=A0A420I381_9PEZI|nr:putative protein ilm1 [Erysiphe neolycopersici]
MALISATTIITSLSLFHITLAFFFLTSPISIADQTLVFIIGEAMKLNSKANRDVSKPHKRSFDNQSPPLAFLAAVLLLLGISDLVSISKVDEITQLHWGAQAPIRLFIFFILTFYAFMFSKSSPFYATTSYIPSTWGEGLKNRIFFTWAFVEMIAWFWVYVTLREERKELLLRMQQKKAAEEDN